MDYVTRNQAHNYQSTLKITSKSRLTRLRWFSCLLQHPAGK